MAVIDVVKWNAPNNVYAWKFPSEELSTWSQLIVSESQEAVLLLGGQMFGPFGPGRHTLSTENIPLLTSLIKIPFGGKSPFTAEVWFVNKTMPLDVKWGTSDPIQIMDPQFNIMVPVRAYGQFGLQIDNTKKFLIKLVGTMASFDRETMSSYFKGLILTKTKTAIASCIIKSKVPVLQISALLNDISNLLKDEISKEMSEFGIKTINFYVNSINVPENDPAVIKLKESLAKKAEMNILGFTYQQERSFDVLQGAAENSGSGQSGLMGAGIGLGMGVGLGGSFGGMMGQMGQQLQTTGVIICSACNAQNTDKGKFCLSCGKPITEKHNASNPESDLIECDKCKIKSKKGAKFCPNCGKDPIKKCKCGKEISPEGKFCPDCGTSQI